MLVSILYTNQVHGCWHHQHLNPACPNRLPRLGWSEDGLAGDRGSLQFIGPLAPVREFLAIGRTM
ncbi:hypothetical protein M407DRAFT_242910, partial [Tulasnella calospora MUT 4182]